MEHKKPIKTDLDEIEDFLDLKVGKFDTKLSSKNYIKQKSAINGYNSDAVWTIKTAYKNIKRAIEKFINEI